jgi:hypothetical protein
MSKSVVPSAASTQVWVFEEHPGYRRAMESAGTVAAPLLAGFSFALLFLLMPTLEADGGEVAKGVDASGSKAFSAVPELAAILLLGAGLLFIASVQAAISSRYHGHAPSDLEEVYPDEIVEVDPANPDAPPHSAAARPGWEVEGWPALRTDRKWYPGWLRKYFYEELVMARRWAAATRHLYHLGILALLLGLVAAVIPPAEAGGFGRWTLVAVAVIGAVCELGWIASTSAAVRGWRTRIR